MDGEPAGTGTGPRVVAGRYTLLAPLGTGGMATVWRARDDVLGREVAIKEVVAPSGLADAERAVLFERTRREARAAARLDHPSAVTVYDVVEDAGSPFLVMELVPARTLAEVVRGEGPLEPGQAAEVGLALLGALATAHSRGIVHRDVKPSNVLLSGDRARPGRVVLTDFGIATSAGDVSITGTGLLLGSPSYIAPERARGRPPGPASDLWSLGATLFTAVEGRPPFDAGDPLSTVTAVVAGDRAPFVLAGPLEPVICALLVGEPAERLDAGAARVMLQQVLQGAGAPTPAAELRRRQSAPSAGGSTRLADAATDAVARAQRTSALPSGPAGPGRPRLPQPRRDHGDGPTWGAHQPAPSSPFAGRRPSRRGRVAGLLGAAAVLVAAAALGGVLAIQGSSSPTPSPAPSSPAPAGATPSPSARPSGVPADWQAYTHPTQGWTLWHPASYTVSDRGALKQFRDESTRFTLRVSSVAAPQQGALGATQAFAAAVSTQLGGYAQVRLEPLPLPGQDAAELEFTYTDAGADLRVLNRTLVVNGQAYSLYWQTNADRFGPSLPVFEQIAASFTPRNPG